MTATTTSTSTVTVPTSSFKALAYYKVDNDVGASYPLNAYSGCQVDEFQPDFAFLSDKPEEEDTLRQLIQDYEFTNTPYLTDPEFIRQSNGTFRVINRQTGKEARYLDLTTKETKPIEITLEVSSNKVQFKQGDRYLGPAENKTCTTSNAKSTYILVDTSVQPGHWVLSHVRNVATSEGGGKTWVVGIVLLVLVVLGGVGALIAWLIKRKKS